MKSKKVRDLPRNIIFAAGGTAGHIEPALAVAREWMVRHPDDHCIFIGTPLGMENALVPDAGFILRIIPKVVAPRSMQISNLTWPLKLWGAIAQAREEVADGDLVIGFGGYVSASVYIAARMRKIPIVIHEANAKAGWANRLGAFFTADLALTYPISRGRFARAKKTGLPIRSGVREAAIAAASGWSEARSQAKLSMGWNLDYPTLLILGGSQGSAAINSQIHVAAPALISRGVQILHSVGAKNVLPPSGVNYRATAYIENMAQAYLSADLVISRSGAASCAEIGALSRMALFIPLTIGNGEQAINAAHLVGLGRAQMISEKLFTAEWLLENFEQLLALALNSSPVGLTDDLDASISIVGLMEETLERQYQ